MADTTPYERIPEHDRGRVADAPHEIPPRGWKDILLRVKKEVADDRISVIAGSVAFASVMALFPAMLAMVSLYGLIADPADVEQQLASVYAIMPGDVAQLLGAQMRAIVGSSQGALSLGVVLALLGALWAAAGGVQALITAINVAYDEEERRSFLRLKAISLGVTLLGIVAFAVAVFLVGVLPALLDRIGLGEVAQRVIDVGRWPALAVLASVGLAALYRYAPCRTKPKWTWVSWGSAIATALWLGVSALFSFYVANFGRYNETYGAIGGVIVLLLWLYLSAYAILLGAEINAEMEHQTAKDSTVGEPAPMGQRGAQMADTLGRSYA